MNAIHATIMITAVAAGAVLFWRSRQPLGLAWWETGGIFLGAFCGAMIGAKLPFVLADWEGFVTGRAWFADGKSIMPGLVGGYLGAQLGEWAFGIRFKACDVFAVPVAAAVGIGRIGCFFGPCCYGKVTTLPWGVDFLGDGCLRHPTQIYESIFHLTAAVVMFRWQRRGKFLGLHLRLYFLAYFVFRFFTEFVRPEEPLWLGLTGYQWSALVLAVFFSVWCCPGCRPWRLWRQPEEPAIDLDPFDEFDSVSEMLAGDPMAQPLKRTETLCPICLEPAMGMVVNRCGKVYLRRECVHHGETVALISSDRRHYYLRHEAPHPLGTLPCCSSGPGHRTCIALLELTEKCNLNCPVCFAESFGDKHRRYEDLVIDLDGFLRERGPLDVLHLSGGEPLLHPDLLRLIDYCKTLPIKHVMINTNGLVLLEDRGLLVELARRKPRLEINLQFDGVRRSTFLALRGIDLLRKKYNILQLLSEYDFPTTLVATVAKGINLRELGPLLRLGLKTPQVRGITFQPATWAGRYCAIANPMDRVTLSDVVLELGRQSRGLLSSKDFFPLPCSHPNCCSVAFLVRTPDKPATSLLRLTDYKDHLDVLSDRVRFDLDDARRCLPGKHRPEDFFRIFIKPFMDAYTYDQQRIDECCVHIIRPGGEAVSFCRYNTLERGREHTPPSCPCHEDDIP